MANKELSFEEKEKRLDEILSNLSKSEELSLKEISSLYKEGKEILASLDSELEELKKSVSEEIVLDK
ncbi:MAG: exodeoxyribonuclease VII small subunit [Bacilli bacterium]|jgi:exodeoxyribonuclease VII small subunit|nr:exodeoxyribonuclease VII small subunit [Bacilli bacterium]